MAEIIIHARDVSKRFTIHTERATSLKERVIRRRQSGQDFYALRDVSLEIEHGTTVGLIGAERLGQVDAAEGARRHHAADAGRRRHARPDRVAARARRRVQRRAHRAARTSTSTPRCSACPAARPTRSSTRSSTSPSSRSSSTTRSSTTRRACTCGSASPSPCTSTPTSCSSTRYWPSATSTSSASAWTRSPSSRTTAARSCSSRHWPRHGRADLLTAAVVLDHGRVVYSTAIPYFATGGTSQDPRYRRAGRRRRTSYPTRASPSARSYSARPGGHAASRVHRAATR